MVGQLRRLKMSRLSDAVELIGEKLANKFSKEDPSGKNKYLKWMSEQKDAGQNDADIIGTVKSFHRRADSLTHSDIYKYTDLKVLEDEILKLTPSRAERKDLKNIKYGTDYLTLIETDDFGLYYVISDKGIKNLGKGTRWCIAANSNYWHSYNKENNIFVVTSFKDKEKRYALLHNAYGNYTVYKPDDRTIAHTSVFSPELFSIIESKTKMISFILRGSLQNSQYSAKTKDFVFSIETDKNKDYTSLDVKNAVKFIKEQDLHSIVPYSKNTPLIKHMKAELTKTLRQDWFTDCSVEFLKIFKSNIKKNAALESIKKSSLTLTKIRLLSDAVGKLTVAEFKKLFKEIKFKTTKTSLLTVFPEHIHRVDAKWLTQKMGISLLKQDKENILKVYSLFKSAKSRRNYYGYNYTYTDDSFTKAAKALPLSKSTYTELLEKKDLPAPFKKWINKKLTKPIPAKTITTVQDLLSQYFADEINNGAEASKPEFQVQSSDFMTYLRNVGKTKDAKGAKKAA